MECFCQEKCVIRIVTNMNSLNFGKIFGLVEITTKKNHMENDCNFFKWLGDEIVIKWI